MNAAATLINQNTIFKGNISELRFSKRLYLPLALVIIILINALAVIYTTNQFRLTLSEVEIAQNKTHHLQLEWGQLLLEQASIATPARIQQVATEKLAMVLPSAKQVFTMHV